MRKGYKPQVTQENAATAIKDHMLSYSVSCALVILLPAAIASVTISEEYEDIADTSPCEQPIDGVEEYMVDLQYFCYVAGGVLFLHFLIHFCTGMFGIALFGDEGVAEMESFLRIGAVGFGLFYLIWAAIGLYMWTNQMTEECRKEDIGMMIISWSVIQYGLLGVGCIISCCIVLIISVCLGSQAKKVEDEEDVDGDETQDAK